MSTINSAQQMLATMQKIESLAKNGITPEATPSEGKRFSEVFMQQIENINQSQQTAENLQEDFVLGKNISLAEVKTAELKASLYTHGLIQFRNEVVKAYHEIMNMSI